MRTDEPTAVPGTLASAPREVPAGTSDIAYGIRLLGDLGREDLRRDHSAALPSWRVAWETHRDPDADLRTTDDEALVPTEEGSMLALDRAAATISVRSYERPHPSLVIHPLLAPAAAVIGAWLGRLCMHGGAALIDGRAWVLTGPSSAGKSTLLAELHAGGAPLLADDLCVVASTDDQLSVLAGPGCVDLRPDVGPAYGARSLGECAGRVRWRLPCPGGPWRAPLAGIIDLGWSPLEGVTWLPSGDRIALIAERSVVPLRPELLLDVAAKPMLRVQRTTTSRPADAARRLLEVVRRHSRVVES